MANCGCSYDKLNSPILVQTDVGPNLRLLANSNCPNKNLSLVPDEVLKQIRSDFSFKINQHWMQNLATRQQPTVEQHNALIKEYYDAICSAVKSTYPDSNNISIYAQGDANYLPWLIGAGILTAGIYFIRKSNKKKKKKK